PGDFLDSSNWQQAEGLLPEEFLNAYRSGDFRHQLREVSIAKIGDDPIFRDAIEHNRGRYDLSADGTIIERATGEPPGYIYGWPFLDIEADDPRAAIKIVWNYFFTMYYSGNAHYRADLLWISRSGLDRSVEVDSFVKYYQGQHPRFREGSEHDELLTKTLA